MAEPTTFVEITDKIHKRLAVDLFNATWELIDKTDRTVEEDDAMIHSAHASYYHWSKVGGPEQFTIGEWQVAHVYAILRHGVSALYHANKCLDICTKNDLGDWRLAFAYEAVARAYAALGDVEHSRDNKAKAIAVGETIVKDGERKHFQDELAKGPWFGLE